MGTWLQSAFLFFAVFTATAGECPDGWTDHSGACYIYIKEPYNWFNARYTCQMLDGILAEINTAEENHFVTGIVHSHGGSATWLGMNDIVEEGVFVFSSSQERIEWTNWNAGEPNDDYGLGDCVLMYDSGLWNDLGCQAYNHPFICEKRDNDGEIVG